MESIMKKNCLFLAVALSALSSAALASSNRNLDIRESPTYCGQFTQNVDNQCGPSNFMTKPLAIGKLNAGTMSSFERMIKLSKENDQGRH
jgi:hypothetical protein